MRSKMIGFGVTLVVIVLMGAAAELFLRFVYPLGGVIYQLNSSYFQQNLPNSQKIYVHLPHNGGHRIHVRINSHGFRGEELQVEKTTARVIVFGDSFIAAEYSELENSFTEQLEDRLLENDAGEVEVINAGVVGLGPDQVSLMLDRSIEKYQPDIVVVGVYAGNDFGDLIRNKIYQLDDEDDLVRSHAKPAQALVDEFTLDGMASFALGRLIRKALVSIPRRISYMQLESGTVEKDASKDQADQLYERLVDIARLEFEDYNKAPLTVKNLFNDGYDADIALSPDAPSARHKSKLMTGVVQKIAEIVQTHDVPLVVFAIPSARDIIDKYDGVHIDGSRWPQYDPRRLTRNVCAGLESDQPCIDLYEPFRSNADLPLYFHGGDDHWNDAGQALAAKIIAARLEPLIANLP